MSVDWAQLKSGRLLYQGPWNWHFPYNRAQPLAKALSRYLHTIYLDRSTSDEQGKAPVTVASSHLWHKLWRASAYLYQSPRWHDLTPDLHHVSWAALSVGSGAVDFRDRPASCYRRIKRLLRAHGHDLEAHHPRWLITSRPAAVGLEALTKWDRLILDIEDPWLDMHWGQQLGQPFLQTVASRAHLITANGKRIAQRFERELGVPVCVLPNGVEAELLDTLQAHAAHPIARPPLLQAHSTNLRRVLFTGSINDRVDLAMLHDLIRQVTQLQFIFVGPVLLAGESQAHWQAITKLPHVLTVPAVPHAQLPSWLVHADVLWMPYTTAGAPSMFPAKLLEYLATGQPILSTIDFSDEGIELPTLHYCPDAQALRHWLDRFVTQPPAPDQRLAQRCMTLAKQHTWDARARQLIELIVQADAATASSVVSVR